MQQYKNTRRKEKGYTTKEIKWAGDAVYSEGTDHYHHGFKLGNITYYLKEYPVLCVHKNFLLLAKAY